MNTSANPSTEPSAVSEDRPAAVAAAATAQAAAPPTQQGQWPQSPLEAPEGVQAVPAAGEGGRTRVALVFGGRSGEHSISCITAAGILSAIDRERYDVLPIGITRTGKWVLMPDDPEALRMHGNRMPEVPDADEYVALPLEVGKRQVLMVQPVTDDADVTEVPPPDPTGSLGEIDVVFPVLHGPYGEDGTVQGLLELADLPYVGCGVLSSAMMMDKHYMKVALVGAGLPVGPYQVITDRQWLTDREAALERVKKLEFPVFVKPCRAGSSLGITRVSSPDGLVAAIEEARRHDPKVIVEQGIVGREIECGVLGGRGPDAPRASLPGEIAVADHDFYDYEAKYLGAADVTLSCPADLPEKVIARVRQVAVEAFEAAGCEGLARCDFFVTDSGEVVINELNTMPGFTPISMFPSMWEATGLSYTALITDLIEQAMERRTGLR